MNSIQRNRFELHAHLRTVVLGILSFVATASFLFAVGEPLIEEVSLRLAIVVIGALYLGGFLILVVPRLGVALLRGNSLALPVDSPPSAAFRFVPRPGYRRWLIALGLVGASVAWVVCDEWSRFLLGLIGPAYLFAGAVWNRTSTQAWVVVDDSGLSVVNLGTWLAAPPAVLRPQGTQCFYRHEDIHVSRDRVLLASSDGKDTTIDAARFFRGEQLLEQYLRELSRHS